MKAREQQFCDSLLSIGESKGSLKLVQITRGGALLMALPKNKRVALAITDLYQPQKLKGRLLRRVVRWLVITGLHGLLPKASIDLGSDGLLDKLGLSGFSGEFGFLLGGQDSANRSMIGIYAHEGSLRVVKCGFSHASDAIIREYDIMRRFATSVSSVPEPYDLIKLDNGSAYTCELVLGKSPRGAADDALVMSTLTRWLDQAEKKKISEIPIWSVMKNELTDTEYVEVAAMEDLEVRCPVMHGDFTPWNIKILNGNEIRVLDWEHAEDQGIPGWDIIHYNVQRLMLVEHATAHRTVETCLDLLRKKPILDYLEKAGLEGREFQVLLSYLYYTGRVFQYPRGELVSVCRELQTKA